MSLPCAAARVLSVNLARVRPNPFKDTDVTGMEKVPVADPVQIRAPGSKADGLGSGLVGDTIGDRVHHGGDDQAVYAYAREDLDYWEGVLDRTLPPGSFGENLTTAGVDVTNALIGERWRLGAEVELQVTCPRIPCATFRGWIDVPGWLKHFTAAGMPGAYLRVTTPGYVQTADALVVLHRPGHQVSIGRVFRALTLDRDLLASLLSAGDDLTPELQELAAGHHRRTM